MSGVQTYPYTVSQRLYNREFSAIAAYTIQHPYMATAKPCGSTPHNILSGSGFADTAPHMTEAESQYGYKSYVQAKQAKASGIRVEQIG